MNGHSKRRNTGGVPPRWLRCPRFSDGFVGDKFLVFKTPLSEQYDDYVTPEFRCYPHMVFDYVKARREKLGLWIDLTNTDRFYSKEEIEASGAKYVKIQCRGHGETPSADQVRLFIQICDKFTENNPNDKIGVHCTHGFNRSGYLICSFLVKEWDWDVRAALTHFASKRRPGIYKQDYINQLCQEFVSPDDDEPIPSAPGLPEWCFDGNDDVDDDGFSHTSNNNPSSSNTGKRSNSNANESHDSSRFKRRRELYKENPTFMEGVSGVTAVTDREKLSTIQRKVQTICEWRGAGFPGSQPVSMDVNNLKFLAEKPYMVSWKADGTRYLMLIDGPQEIYFVDRDNCVFQAPGVTFPYRKDLNVHIHDTLVDGEMVLDKVNDEIIPRYLIYDIIRFRGEEVGKCDFRIRLSCIQKELIGPRIAAMERGIIDRLQEPFGIRFKTFWFLEDTEKLLTGRFAQELIHEPDGIIFQPTKEPYKAGRCDDVLKWKPPHLNTIDFRLKIVQQSGEGLLSCKVGELYVGGMDIPFSKMKVTKDVSKLNGKIIECKYDGKSQSYVFLRERTDKSFPNAFTTAKAVVHSIMQPVTQDILLNYIHHKRYQKPHNM